MKNVISMFTVVCLSIGLLVSLAGCNKDNDGPQVQASALSVYNLSPDNISTQFVLSGNMIGQALPYQNVYSYVSIYPGTRDLQVYGNSSSLTTTTYTFDTSKYYSAFFIGANNEYSIKIVKDEYDSMSTSAGRAFIRFVYAVPDSSKPVVTMKSADSTAEYEGVRYSDVSSFIPVTPGNIEVNANNDSTIQVSRAIEVEQNKVYTIMIMGMTHATDETKAIQIKYITNGTLEATQQNSSSNSAVLYYKRGVSQ